MIGAGGPVFGIRLYPKQEERTHHHSGDGNTHALIKIGTAGTFVVVKRQRRCDVVGSGRPTEGTPCQIGQHCFRARLFFGSCLRLTHHDAFTRRHVTHASGGIRAGNHGFFQAWHAGGVMYFQRVPQGWLP